MVFESESFEVETYVEGILDPEANHSVFQVEPGGENGAFESGSSEPQSHVDDRILYHVELGGENEGNQNQNQTQTQIGLDYVGDQVSVSGVERTAGDK